jgi:hypothetical protein
MPTTTGCLQCAQDLEVEPWHRARRHRLTSYHGHYDRGCQGTLLTLYARLGSGSTWTKAGRYCRRCQRFWPTPAVAQP